MTIMHARIGDEVTFSKTVGESDVYMFAGITGDFSGNHVDEEFMKKSKYGQRIAHGALLIGYMSTTSTLMIAKSLEKGIDNTPVSLGYDRIRFLKPVFTNDTMTARYTIEAVEPEQGRTRSKIEVVNQHGEVCLAGTHILKWVAPA